MLRRLGLAVDVASTTAVLVTGVGLAVGLAAGFFVGFAVGLAAGKPMDRLAA